MKSRLHNALTIVSLFSALPLLAEKKEPKNSVDHAGILQNLGKEDLAAGKTIYASFCTNCHGADGLTPQLPLARAFGKGELKFGKDPYSMFLTLTNGNGQMGPQTWMTPKERYQVIHYIRETFMRSMRDDFEEMNDGYLEGLPTVNVAVNESDKAERDFGPALASQLRRDFPSVLTVKLSPETTLSYNLHTLDQAGIWTGKFLNLQATQHYRERGGGVAEPGGELLPRMQGWRWGHDGTLDYPTEQLPARGPMPEEWMTYKGHYLHGNRTILSYAIDGRDILEMPTASPGLRYVGHNFEIGPGKELLLAVGEFDGSTSEFSGSLRKDAMQLNLTEAGEIQVLGAPGKNGLGNFFAATAWGNTDGLSWTTDEKCRLVLRIPADDEKRSIRVLRFADEGEGKLLAFANLLRSETTRKSEPINPSEFIGGSKPRWPQILETSGTLGSESEIYTLDKLEIPPNDGANPYNVWFRTSALAFFPDGRMVVSTHGGDVWIVSGVDASLKNLRWKRYAAGLYEPFGLQVIDGLIYVTCKDRLTRLHDHNGDGEADFYESFSADDDVSVNFHAFNFDLQRDKEGNLYYAKSGQYTDYKLPGAIIKISPDGKKREVYATGLRTPNGMGILPDGRPTVSDNQGTWMPASKISLCEPGGFYGYVQTAATKDWAPDGGKIDHTKVVAPPTFDQPLIWMPQNFDNSSGGQLWIDDDRWGPLSGRLLHTSFGKGWLYYMMMQEVAGVSQAAIVKLDLDAPTGIHRARVNPVDGQVYTTGLNGWNGQGRKGLSQGGISRFRYTGAEAKLLTGVEVVENGIRLEFNFALSPKEAKEVTRYDLEQWNYLWASRYGSDKYSLKNEWKVGTDKVVIEKAIPDADRKAVTLVIPNIQPVNQVHLRLNLIADDESTFEEEAYLTINAVPGGAHPDMKEITKSRVVIQERIAREAAEQKKKKDAAKKNQAKPKAK